MVVKIEIYGSALMVFAPDRPKKAPVRRWVWGI
jgi:hypothetical protein